jgi:hypothetical protein
MRKPVLVTIVTLVIGALFGGFGPSGWPTPAGAQEDAKSGSNGSILPFPATPSASVAGPTLQESTMKWRVEPEHLKPGAPNILIVLIDDVGFGLPDTFGGEAHTPTLTRLATTGLCYNAFHTT